MNLYRSNQVYVSNEAMFYAKLQAKKNEKDQTLDEVISDAIIELFGSEAWKAAWEEYETAKQQSKKRYEEIEQRAQASNS